jgi:hypothetical protein
MASPASLMRIPVQLWLEIMKFLFGAKTPTPRLYCCHSHADKPGYESEFRTTSDEHYPE